MRLIYRTENVPLRGIPLSLVGQAVQSWIANEMPGLMFEGDVDTCRALASATRAHHSAGTNQKRTQLPDCRQTVSYWLSTSPPSV